MNISKYVFALAAAVILSGCAASGNAAPAAEAGTETAEEKTTAEVTEPEDTGAEGQSEDPAAEQTEGQTAAAGDTSSPAAEADPDLVTIVIPTVYESINSQEEADEIRDRNGYESAVLEEDGSLSITMSRSRQEELLSQFRTSVDDAIAEIVNGDGSSIEKIEYNDSYSVFTVTVSGDEIGTADRQTAEELVMYGTLYHIYSGNDTDHIQVDYVGSGSGEVIESADSGSLGEAY